MKLHLVSFFLLPAFFSFGQNDTGAFPRSWEGQWAGQLEIFTTKGRGQQLPMELHILPLSDTSWTWTIIYGEDKEAGRRSYELIAIDTSKGQYLIDEKNTIAIQGYYLGGSFFQWFEVQSSRLLATTKRVADTLYWEIVVGGTKPVSTTGGQVFENEEIPPVHTFNITNFQRAVLKKKKE